MRCRWLLLSLLLPGCDKSPPTQPPSAVSSSAKAIQQDPCAKAKPEGPIAWIHDDYDAALSCARSKGLPLVIDLWAPWCHTCLSMKNTVLRDASFAADAQKFVFAALDTDRERNAPALAKFPIAAWPTYYVAATDERLLARFVGAANAAQFQAFLSTGLQAALRELPTGHGAFLLAAERALVHKDLKAADLQLSMAVSQAPVEWPRLPDALVSWIATKHKLGDFAGCLDIVDGFSDKLGKTASTSDFWSYAMTCADGLLSSKPDPVQISRVKKLRNEAVTRWRELLRDPQASLSIDDRSDALVNLRETLIALKQPAAAKTVAEEQRVLLDDAASQAPTPMAAMTYNAHRAEVYAYLGRPLDLVPALQKSAQDLPDQYDPAARLGWLLLKAGKLQDAATWTDKALTLVRGPRTARLLGQRAEIARELGDKVGEKQYRQRAVQVLESLPPSQVTPELIAQAKTALAALE
jgi:thioredoxin-like negative regulator of GroEL